MRTLLLRRSFLFFGALCYMQWGPIQHQLLGYRPHPYSQVWRMYYGHGIHICEVDYFRRTKQGGDVPVSRYKLLGHDPKRWWEAPFEVRFIGTPKGVEEIGAQMCKRMRRGADLRAEARCGSVRGWTPRMNREKNLCRP